MDFREAESKFLQLQENYQNGAISEESFFQSVSKLMVQDARGVYWTIDPKTGSWLFYDGHVWQRSVPPTKEITDKIKRIPKPRRTGGWVFGLLLGGFVTFGVLVVVSLIIYRTFILVSPPEIPSPANGTLALVGEDMPGPLLRPFTSPQTKPLPDLVVLQGSADVRSGKENSWRPVEGDSSLQVGEIVRTHDSGRVQLVFSEGIVTELGENTEVLLQEAAFPENGLAVIGLFLSYGDTWHRLDIQETSVRYEIETASARVALEGTLIHVLSGLERETLVEVVEGDTVVTGAGETLKLTVGQKARVELGKVPVLFPTPLLPLPTLTFIFTPTETPYD